MNVLKRYHRIRQERRQTEDRIMQNTLLEMGISHQTEATPRRIATVLSFVIPGSGQIYRGHIALGFLWLFIVVGGYYAVPILGVIMHIFCVCQAHSLTVDKDVADYVHSKVGAGACPPP